MPTVTDWLMVMITFVYVVATIMISKANIESAKATREQLEQSKKQFVENQRLQVMPSLQIEIKDGISETGVKEQLNFSLFFGDALEHCCSSCFSLSFENAGLGTAKNIAYEWHFTGGEVVTDHFPVSVLYQQDSVEYLIFVGTTEEYAATGSENEVQLVIVYKDLLDNDYRQSIHLHFEITEDRYPRLMHSNIEKIELL